MSITRSLTLAPLLAILLVAACAGPVVPPVPTSTPIDTPSPIPATATAPATATLVPTSTLPAAIALPLAPTIPPSPTYIPTPGPTWTLPPPTITPTRLPATATSTRPPATATLPATPDPLGSRPDRISGAVTWRGTPLNGIPVDLYADIGPWCAPRSAVAHTQTDGAGRYVFLDVQPGTYWLAINSDRFAPGSSTVVAYSWLCTDRLAKGDAAKVFDTGLFKTDLKINFPTLNISFNNPYPTFSWEAYPDAAYYTVILDLFADSTRRVENDTRSNGQSFVPRTPLGLGKYNLRVSAWDARQTRIAIGDVGFAVQ